MKEYVVKIQMRDSTGLVLTEVVKTALAPEIVLLQHIHGTNSVVQLSGPVSRSPVKKDLYARLAETYGHRLIQNVIGSSGASLPMSVNITGADADEDGDEDESAEVETVAEPRRGRGRPPHTEPTPETESVFS